MTSEITRTNPTLALDVGFSAYMMRRKAAVGAHTVGGIPDYAYGVDYEMMRKMNAVPGAYAFFKTLTNSYVPRFKQEYNMHFLKVGPSQHPHIHEQVKECARLLGIGIPEVFIEPNAEAINAYTIASEDSAPVMVMTSALVERLTPGEIKTIIGHECGHIHNNHTIYETAANLVLDSISIDIPFIKNIPIAGNVLELAKEALHYATGALRFMMKAWSMAAEVTADRAGLICADNFDDAITAECKLLYGAPFTHDDINIDAILKQYDRMRSTPVRMLELKESHPSSVRRILAIREFMNSEALYMWRPEHKKAGMELIGKQELDARCEKYISVTKSDRRRSE